MEDKNTQIISVIKEKLAEGMSRVEQNIDWESALNPERSDSDTDAYYKACIVIVEPRFGNSEIENEFYFMLENDTDSWEKLVKECADEMVHKNNWINLIPVFKKFGY